MRKTLQISKALLIVCFSCNTSDKVELQQTSSKTILKDANSSIKSYNRALELLESEYTKTETEKKLIAEVDSLSMEATKGELTTDEHSKFMIRAYNLRALKMIKVFTEEPSDSLSELIESFYKKALFIDEKSFETNYNFGIFYYNQGVAIIDSINENATEEAVNIQHEKAVRLFKKAQPYMEKSVKMSKIIKNNNFH